MEHIMLTRAWVIHIFLQVFRLFNIVRGNSFISVHREREDVGKVDDDLLDQLLYVWLALVLLAMALDVVCYKKRQVARVFYPLELIKFCFVNVLPYGTECQSQT